MQTLKFIQKRSIMTLFIVSLAACGGGGGGDNDQDDYGGGGGAGGGGGGGGGGNQSSYDYTVDSPETLVRALEIDGAVLVNGSLPVPEATEGGTLNVSPEVAVTSGGSSQLSVQASVPEGHYVHAYLLQVEGTDQTFVIPVDANGQALNQRPISSAMSDVLTRAAKGQVNAASPNMEAGRVSVSPLRLGCFINPRARVNQVEAHPVRVQAYVSDTPPVHNVDFMLADTISDFSFLQHPINWTESVRATVKTVPVGTGDFQVTLTWDTTADVDLRVTEPGGNVISYIRPRSHVSDGFLDVDDTDGFGPENIFYENNIPAGTYSVSVNMYSGWGDELPTNYTVTIKRNGSTNTFTGTLNSDDETHLVESFTMTGSSGGSGGGSGDGSGGGSGDSSGGGSGGGSGDGSGGSSGGIGGGSNLDLGSCGIKAPGFSICYTSYPIEACETLQSGWSGTYNVTVYSRSGGCGGGYNCNIAGDSFDPNDINNCLD